MISARSIEQTVGLAMLALIGFGSFLVLKPFLFAIVWAAVLSYSTWPLFVWLKSRLGQRTTLAAAVMLFLVTCLFVAPVAALAWSMTDQVVRVTTLARGWLEHGAPSLPSWVEDIPVLGERLATNWSNLFQKGGLAQVLASHVGMLRSQLLALAATTANALFELALSLVIAFFLYCNGPELSAAIGSIGTRLTGTRGDRLISIVARTVTSVVTALVVTNFLQAVLGAFGFWLAGLPGPLLLGFFIFFLNVIPFGAGLVWVPAAIWLINAGNSEGAFLLAVWCILVFPLLENIVRPYLMRRGNILSAVPLLLGMLGGMAAFGFLGIFLGPALLALILTLLEEWRCPAQTPRETTN
jgi:predicted PurR-regulated permease PerM